MTPRIRICVPEDHNPDGTVARWTAIADIRPGHGYTYSTIGFSVYLDWGLDPATTVDPSWQTGPDGFVRAPLINEGKRDAD